MSAAMERFSPATREWFAGAFDAPTAAQEGAWEAISHRRHTLVVAPTGSGKTLSAFLWSLDRLTSRDPEPVTPVTEGSAPTESGAATSAERRPATPGTGTRVLYVSPLKALGVDVERNLRSPLVGITQTAARLGMEPADITVGVRSGDTPASERRRLAAHPPDILITTPESLFLMLTSKARQSLQNVDTVIIDEIHAVAATKRGAHLAVSLERLDAMLARPAQRIGLSATVRPLDEVARFLGGTAPVEIVAPDSPKTIDLRVTVPVEDLTDPSAGTAAHGSDGFAPDDDAGWDASAAGPTGAEAERNGSVWPHIEASLADEILAHRSTIVFANSRRLAERLTSRLNEIHQERLGFAAESTPADAQKRTPSALAGASGQTEGLADDAPILARAHHGSVSKEQRAQIEDDLKSGALRCVVATSSLELGIDMGEVDLVVQVESPPSVASALQRIGRAGHHVGDVSTGVLYPKHRADLVSSAVTAERTLAGQIEALRIPANPLDILAQQTIAATALDPVDVEGWFDTLHRSAPFASLPRSAYEATLDLLAGRYPSDEFAELRPRVVWDRDTGVLTARPGAQRLAVTSGGTIPDRGLFAVYMVSGDEKTGTRVGELDEEMVYESRVGDVFALGATSWRIHEITYDRVLVTPEYGQPGRLPFWKGDSIGRPCELGEALGRFTREVDAGDDAAVEERLTSAGLDRNSIVNLRDYLRRQREATGHVPTDRTLVVERSRDELGDWRIVLHSPFGMQVHAPWALAVDARIAQRFGIDGSSVAADDGIIVRVPETTDEPPGAELFVFDPDEIEQTVTAEVGGSALFASRFRECSARALLLPNYSPGSRSPLWQQRQRAAQLLDVAKKYPQFPMLLETVRECLQDVYDVPALVDLSRRIQARSIRLVDVATEDPSPYARSLLFGYVGAFMYEGDSPLAERKAAALSLDSSMLSELLGRVELSELLDPDVIEQTERELQRLMPERRLTGVEGTADLLRMLGPLTVDELAQRLSAGEDAAAHAQELVRSRRALELPIAGTTHVCAIEDAARLRDAVGTPLPIGVPAAFIEPVDDPLGDLIARFARTHGPFRTADAAARLGLGTAVVAHALSRLADEGRVLGGSFLPDAGTPAGPDHGDAQWCDRDVLRRLRLRSLAALRHEVEPVDPSTFARFLPAWQHVGGDLQGTDGVAAAIDQLSGVALPASAWESLILPQRVPDYTPAMLDELTSTGEVIWSGHGPLPGGDGWIALHTADSAEMTLPTAGADESLDAVEREVLAALGSGGAFFAHQLLDAAGLRGADGDPWQRLEKALWNLVWSGLVTNDTFTPVRMLTGGHGAHKTRRSTPRARSYRRRGYARPSFGEAGSSGAPRFGAAGTEQGVGARLGATARAGTGTLAGRWSVLPLADPDPTRRAAATAEILLERYGVLTRGSVLSEGVPGGFALMYRVLSGFEEKGHARRGYVVDGLGGAQFSTSATIDRLRTHVFTDDRRPRHAVTLAATDPANPYGAALPWPATDTGDTRHRPGRKAGGLVTLVDGDLVLYLERGGRSALTFDADEQLLDAAAASVADLVRAGGIEKIAVEKVDGRFVFGSTLEHPLRRAGFTETPKGLRMRRG